MKLWSIMMLFLWRLRLGYWDWDAFWAAWNQSPNSVLNDGQSHDSDRKPAS